MKLYGYRDPIGNFGDDLNLWLWPRLVPGIFDEDDGRLFLGIGTLLNHRVPTAPRKIVFGTGVGYGELPSIDTRWKIYCVRGPLSARALDLPPSCAATDPAVFVRDLELPSAETEAEISFMPHHRSMHRAIPWARYCRLYGIQLIDPRGPLLPTLGALRGSKLVVTESLHGAIVADALRIPWIAIRLFDLVLASKWEDWCASVGLHYDPVPTPRLPWPRSGLRSRLASKARAALLVRHLKRVAGSVRPQMSAESDFERAYARLEDHLARFRSDWRISGGRDGE